MTKKWVSKTILKIAMALIFIQSVVRGGTGISTDTYTEPGFDFYLSYPCSWKLIDGNSVGGNWSLIDFNSVGGNVCPGKLPCRLIKISNAERVKNNARASSVNIAFVNKLGLSNLNELKILAKQLHPEISNWVPLANTQYSEGFTSGEMGGEKVQSLEEVQFYLTGPDQFVQISSLTFPDENGTWGAQFIKESVDRRGKSPEVLSIDTDKKSYVVGDIACYFVGVRGLAGTLSKASLQSFVINGAEPHWNQMKVEYLEQGNGGKFKICVKVTERFKEDGLSISEIILKNSFDQSRKCTRFLDSVLQLKCEGDDKTIAKIQPKTGAVSDARGDNLGPTLLQFHLGEGAVLNYEVSDDTGVSIAEIFLDSKTTILLYPEDLTPGSHKFALGKLVQWGRNTLRGLELYDHNGARTTYRINSKSGGSFYECVQQEAPCANDTKFEIVTYLSQPNGK